MARNTIPAGLGRIVDEQDGAVTVDWVVLTAATVSMGMIVGMMVWGNTGSIARNVSSYLGTQSVISTF